MGKKKYYTVIYEAMYPDSGVITYSPINIIKGFYDVENEIFIEEGTNREYKCVNMAVPNFGDNEDHVVDALSNEIVEYSDENEHFFAFPVDEITLINYYKDDLVENIDVKELYEREVRGFLLYSIYDESIDDNIYFVADKLEEHLSYNVDVSLDILLAVNNSKIMSENSKSLFLVLSADDFDSSFSDDKDDYLESREEQLRKKSAFTEIVSDFDPDDLEQKICSEVIAQNHVATALVSMLYKNKRYCEHDGLKSNMLILGPSGCGKTELVRAIKRNTKIPIAFFDASTATASGYVGNSISEAIRNLINVCGGDINKAENGIIFIDEIDKLVGEGISKRDVQDELFKMLEGDEIIVSSDNIREKTITFNPKNVTFICAGAAQDLIMAKKKEKNKLHMGFCNYTDKENSDDEEIIIKPEDLIGYGLKAELLRRLPIIKVVKELNKNDLVKILTDSNISSLKVYEKAFHDVENTKLIYDDKILDIIAEKAIKEKAGASGLKRVIDDMLQVAVRKVRVLNGAQGELLLKKETIDDPSDFELYMINDESRKQIYPPPEQVKVKKLGVKK